MLFSLGKINTSSKSQRTESSNTNHGHGQYVVVELFRLERVLLWITAALVDRRFWLEVSIFCFLSVPYVGR